MVDRVANLAVSPADATAQVDAQLSEQTGATEVPATPPNQKSEQIAQTIVLAVLFAGPALMCVHAASAADPDIWWHLRTGEWILQHHAVPQTDPFSGPLAGKPWQAYSWLFELIVIKLFHGYGLAGMVGYIAAMVLTITVALRHLVKRLQSDFSIVTLLTFATCYSLGHLYTPRPWLFTILFAVFELDILMHVRRTGRTRELLWLPVIFALWGNIHIEFIDGLLILGLAFVESVIARWWPSGTDTRVRPMWLGGALVASVLATLANPYGWRLYGVVYDYTFRLAKGGALNMVSELQAIPFRDASDFLLLFFALAATAALAWHRRFVLFEVGLLIFAAVTSFRSERDIWIMALAAVTILASSITSERPAIRLPKLAPFVAFAAAALALPLGFRLFQVDNAMLKVKAAEHLPVYAVEAIQAKGYPGPLFDDYDWGGYLMWNLRMPVSMDGRASFYGDERITRSISTWNAHPDWASDEQLTSAGLVIGPVNAALTQLLRKDSQFQLVYEDKLAAVFIRRK
jgi:hypothetical protein